jgi:ribose transport system substrate-binding protein
MDWMLGLDIEEAGQLVQSRITGAFQGVKARLPNLPVENFVRIDGRGLREKSYRVILDFLNRHPKEKHILIAAANDTSAMGAIAAVRELGREKQVAVVGQDCVDEMLREMLKPGSPAIGSISHEVQLYGAKLVDLGLALLRGETVAPYNYVEHRVVTPDMAGRFLESVSQPASLTVPVIAAAETGEKKKSSSAKKSTAKAAK